MSKTTSSYRYSGLLDFWGGRKYICNVTGNNPQTNTTKQELTIMTKKHFIAMAREFKELLELTDTKGERDGITGAIEAFMRVALSINPRFDRSRFKSACGLDG